MDIADKTRLTKLIGMLGSAFDGERANAAAMITKMAEQRKMSITELIAAAMGGSAQSAGSSYRRPDPKPEPKPKPKYPWEEQRSQSDKLLRTLREIAKDPDRYEFVLTQWECDFASDVSSRYVADYELSAKQILYVQKIIQKATRNNQQGG